MNEGEHVARLCRAGAGVHLTRPAARASDDAIGQRPCDGDALVVTPAIDRDNFRFRCAAAKRAQGRRDRALFIKHRDDDRELHDFWINQSQSRD